MSKSGAMTSETSVQSNHNGVFHCLKCELSVVPFLSGWRTADSSVKNLCSLVIALLTNNHHINQSANLQKVQHSLNPGLKASIIKASVNSSLELLLAL